MLKEVNVQERDMRETSSFFSGKKRKIHVRFSCNGFFTAVSLFIIGLPPESLSRRPRGTNEPSTPFLVIHFNINVFRTMQKQAILIFDSPAVDYVLIY